MKRIFNATDFNKSFTIIEFNNKLKGKEYEISKVNELGEFRLEINGMGYCFDTKGTLNSYTLIAMDSLT